ncbi:MAG: nuclear transport factor 2 family protein [Gemmatimonadota bacterium]|nr:nuclear transport factor 2 family protein [Gemmatimonadota bacterium]
MIRLPETKRTVRVALLVLATLVVSAAPARGQAAASDDPVAVVRHLFDAMRAKDTTAMRALFHPDARLFGTAQDSSGVPIVRVTPVGTWLAGIPHAPVYLDERLLEVETRVSGGLATIWATYAFYADTSFSHCGVDAFQLARTTEGWKIIQVADTRQREGCDIPGGD